ncbi:MAG: hypothetical protein PHD72_00670 [Patescibacteria group bacterium]|nr:hypothetical protein [Patescibacteria group bacterium]
MRIFWGALIKIFAVVAVFTLNIFAMNVLPFPFNRLNIIFTGVFLFLLFGKNNRAFWFIAPLALLAEFFSSMPFGANAAAIIAGMVVIEWTLLNLLTTRTLLTCGAAFLIGFVVYRLTFIAALIFFQLLGLSDKIALTKIFFANIGTELAVNIIFVLLLYPIISFFVQRPNPRYLTGRAI